MSDIVERLHDCKRGLSTATSEDYNNWWREIKQLRERAVYDHDCLTVIESERNEAVADLAEAEALLLYANCSREWYDKRDTFLARRSKT